MTRKVEIENMKEYHGIHIHFTTKRICLNEKLWKVIVVGNDIHIFKK